MSTSQTAYSTSPRQLHGRCSAWLNLFAGALVLILGVFSSRADDVSARFDAANKLYEQGKFSAAIKSYDELLATGKVSSALYFNRGDAFFKAGELGQAIASYRQAEQLAPRDHALRANLQFVRARARGGAPLPGNRASDWLGYLSLNEWALLFGLSLWLMFIFLICGEWKTDLKPKLKKGFNISICATVLFGVCLGVRHGIYRSPTAIVTAGEADVRNGPLDESPSLFKVRDGMELEVLDQKDNWLQVQDSAQRTGWLRRDDALLFKAGSPEKSKS
jgi:tetratricopeptide (TPR) repeat protein